MIEGSERRHSLVKNYTYGPMTLPKEEMVVECKCLD